MSEASQEFVAALEGLMESLQLRNRGLLCDWKLTPVRVFVLRWLAKAPDANMSALARLLEVRPQTLTPIVDSLEKEGLLRRVRSTEDRRESHLELTPKGERLLESLRASIRGSLAAALDEVPATSLKATSIALRHAAANLDLDQSRVPMAPPGRRRSSGRPVRVRVP
jgi:DNA-binding MarR family transcriptional regulator